MSGQVICEVCGLLVDSNKYERHKKFGHKENKDNRCSMCDKTFTSSFNLKYHIAHHINARSFLCNECPNAYNTASDLAQHQRTHDKGRDPFYCEECGMYFEKRSKFNTHMKIHKTVVKQPDVPKKVEPKECPICEKSFVCLSKHNRTVHMNQRNYNCDFCDKKFGKKSGLDRHVLTVHKKEKNFKCNECGKAFAEKAQLKKHERLHLVTYCAKCKNHFEDIKLHNEEKHSNLKHSCETCFKVFERSRDLKCHIKTKHSTARSYFCDYCDKGFAEKFQIERHMKVHKRQFLKNVNIKKEDEFMSNQIEDNWDGFSSDQDDRFSPGLEDRFSPGLESRLSPVLDDRFSPDIELKFRPEQNIKEENKIDDNQEQVFKKLNTSEFKIKEEVQDDDIEIIKYDFQPINPFSVNEIYLKEEQDDVNYQSHDSILIGLHENLKKLCQSNRVFKKEPTVKNAPKKKGSTDKNVPKKKGPTDKNAPKKDTHEMHNDKFICDLCGSQFSYKKTAQKHMDSIHKKIRHECEICHKTFTAKNSVYTHKKVVHERKRSHECQFCKKMFGVRYALTKHINLIHAENPSEQKKYECNLCGKNFTSNSGLYTHKRGVHEKVQRPKATEYPCKICLEPLKTKHHNLVHTILVHLNGKKLKRTCGYCKQEFDLYDDLKNHLDLHFGIFICMICDQFYFDEESLNTHKKVHKTVDVKYRNYSCDHCGERLLTKLQMKVHLRTHTSGLKLYYCDYCGKGFKFSSSLYTHRKYHEEGRFACAYCGKKFARNTDFVLHTRTHTNEKPFKCEICGRGFASKNLLKFHYQTHPESRRFKCRKCQQVFVTKVQLTDHENHFHPESRPYFCDICNMSFKYEHNLMKHNLHKHS